MAKRYTLPKIFCRLNPNIDPILCHVVYATLGKAGFPMSIPLNAGSIAFVHQIPSDVAIMH